MSADNGIYILATKGPEYRVGYHMTIDNIYGSFSDESMRWNGNPKMIHDYFHTDQMFSTIEDALDYANQIVYNYDYLEDGICMITDFEDWDFNSLEKNYGKEAKVGSR